MKQSVPICQKMQWNKVFQSAKVCDEHEHGHQHGATQKFKSWKPPPGWVCIFKIKTLIWLLIYGCSYMNDHMDDHIWTIIYEQSFVGGFAIYDFTHIWLYHNKHVITWRLVWRCHIWFQIWCSHIIEHVWPEPWTVDIWSMIDYLYRWSYVVEVWSQEETGLVSGSLLGFTNSCVRLWVVGGGVELFFKFVKGAIFPHFFQHELIRVGVELLF